MNRDFEEIDEEFDEEFPVLSTFNSAASLNNISERVKSFLHLKLDVFYRQGMEDEKKEIIEHCKYVETFSSRRTLLSVRK